MEGHQDDRRRRDLECDRRFSAALCMSASAILATRIAPAVPAYAALFEPRGGSQIVSPIIWFGATAFAMIMAFIAFDEKRRAAAGAAAVAGAALLAAGVPFARQTLLAFIAGATPAWAAGTVALVTFGLAAGAAVQETGASPGHARFSAGITVLALLMAATDRSGAFSGILAALGLLFFSLYRLPSAE